MESMFRDFIRVVLTIVKKDLLIRIKQPADLAATFVPALGLLLIMALGSVATGRSPVALVVLDHGPKGAQMRQVFYNSDVFRLTDATPQQAQSLFKSVQVVAIVTIPADFTRRVAEHQQAPVLVQVNNLNMDYTNDIRRAVPDAITQFYQAQGHSSDVKITVQEQDLHHADVQLFQYMIIPIIILLLTMSGVVNIGLSTAREWESLTVKELLYAPVARSAIITGKVLGGFIMTMLLGVTLLGFGDVFGWLQPTGIYWLSALATMALISLMGVGLGVAMGAIMQRLQPVIALGFDLVFFLFFLAGGIGVLAFSPAWLQNIAAFVPLSYGRHALEMSLFYNSSDMLGRDIAILGGCAIVAIAVGVLAMRKEIAVTR
jgi:ABC-type multidrug transport system permease subunit